jgi:signal transduction histidine kinase
VAIDREARLVAMNAVAYRILGLPASPGDVGRPIAEVLDAHPELAGVLASAFEVEVLPDRAELRLEPLGRVFGYTMSHVRNQHGDVVGAALMFKDLTLVEQQEERDRLRDRLAALGEMAAAIAHEVKNPLAGIEVMAGILKRQLPESQDAQAILGDIIKEAKMANAIVQEVLEFVRPIRLQVERTRVGEAVQAAVQLAETKARRGDIRVDVRVPHSLPLVHGDQFQLTQLFTNLLTNAYEAMAGQGRVAVAASTIRMVDDPECEGRETREAVVVELADEGPGMPREVADRVFNPFFTTKPQGTGLGLAIVRKIVDAHDGSIDLETVPGRGTRIRVTLPVKAVSELTN